MARGLPEAPKWAWAGIVVGLLAFAGLLPSALHRGAAPTAAGSVPAASAAPQSVKVAFLGDSYMGGTPQDSGPAARWPALVAGPRGWKMLNFAEAGTGYTTAGPQAGASRFIDRVPSIVAAAPAMVIVGGGANDVQASADAFRTAAGEVLQALAAGLPKARLVVLSPFWRAAPPPPVIAERDILRNQAAALGAVFIDVSGIFSNAAPGLIGADGVHPTDAGHARIARLLKARLPDPPGH